MGIRWSTAFLDFPASTFDAGVAFWSEVTGTTLSRFRGANDEFATLLPDSGDAWLRVQRVESGPGGVHLDLHVEDVTTFAWRAISLGAKEEFREGEELVVLTSPGGFAFCVVGWNGEKERADLRPGLVDQVCLDINPSAFDTEWEFWSTLTGWDATNRPESEFASLDKPEGLPLRLLLQRLDDERPGPVTAHLDLAGGDHVEDVVHRHAALGARPFYDGAGWVTLRDPVGREYCVTRRLPLTGRRDD